MSDTGPNDLRVAEEIADRAALAIDTARLFAAESEARAAATEEARRNEVLKDITAAFGSATAVEDVMKAMLDQGIRMAGAVAGTVGLVTEHGQVELVGISGYEPDDHPYWRSFDLDERLPMSEAIRERRPILLSSTQERDRRYPTLIGRGEQRDHALVCLPLMLGEMAIGGFSASYPPETDFGDGDLSFLRAVGEQCAQAIDRARSVGRERETRARFDALAGTSRALASTLDYEATATTVVRLAADHLGGTARLYAREGAALTLLAEADNTGAYANIEGQVTAVDAPPEVATALAQGTPQLLDPPNDDASARPGAVMPLSIAGSTFGALVVTDPARDFRRADELEFAREVARRMSRAMENARLYRERDYVARTLAAEPPAARRFPTYPGSTSRRCSFPRSAGYEVGGDFYDVFETPAGWVGRSHRRRVRQGSSRPRH